jgi:methylenetetrahydrofolate dehydrogenase (NADP+) / methenyltetrahydrofolate cyclohydrolase
MTILDGKKTSQEIKEQIKVEVLQLKAAGGKTPHLAAILVGHDGGSESYVSSKVKDCEEVGFNSTLIRFEDDVTEKELLDKIEDLNENPDVDGFIVQLPLPVHISAQKITEAIKPEKDVDGFHPSNVGRMAINLPCYLPATPFGILQLLERYNVPTSGKHCVVIGRSHIVGSPMSILMARNSEPGNCTVTICHSKTKNLSDFTQKADIVIAALGKPEFLKADMIKEGAVIIDVGTTRVPDNSKKSGFVLKGDVKFDEVSAKASFITPVPGGVGPMTRVGLLVNTLKSAKKEIYK